MDIGRYLYSLRSTISSRDLFLSAYWYGTSQASILLWLLSFFPRGDESDYSEDDLNMNRSDESGSSASRVEPEPVMTIYQEDSLVEQFGASTDQTEELSDENKSIVWFLVKQVSI